MAVTAAQVKELREKTGVGMMECKKALTENEGDIEKAILWLRERGLSRASKKAGRATAEGKVAIAVNSNRDTAVILEVNCETDFVSKNDDFQGFVDSLAHLALESGVETLEAFGSVKTPEGPTVSELVTSKIATIGENIQVRRFGRLSVSNGIVGGYSHMGGKIGAIVALEGQKDGLEELVEDLSMHAAASNPRYLKNDEIPAHEVEQEEELARKSLQDSGKPAEIVEKILKGQMNKFFKEICFVDQIFVKDSKVTVAQLVKDKGKGAALVGYIRFQLGDGVEKKQEDFAAEVAAATKQS